MKRRIRALRYVLADAVLCCARILSAVLVLHVRDVDVTYHIVVHRHILADEEA